MPFPSPEDLPDPGIKARSTALTGGFFTTEPSGKPIDSAGKDLISTHYSIPLNCLGFEYFK